jgi:hypothetical protein
MLLFATAAVLGIAFLFPRVLALPARWWMAFASLLNRISSAIILAIIFFAVITPMGFYRRMTKRKGLERAFDRQATTYWIEREDPSPRADTLHRPY